MKKAQPSSLNPQVEEFLKLLVVISHRLSGDDQKPIDNWTAVRLPYEDHENGGET